jgi:hypothetical protein
MGRVAGLPRAIPTFASGAANVSARALSAAAKELAGAGRLATIRRRMDCWYPKLVRLRQVIELVRGGDRRK